MIYKNHPDDQKSLYSVMEINKLLADAWDAGKREGPLHTSPYRKDTSMTPDPMTEAVEAGMDAYLNGSSIGVGPEVVRQMLHATLPILRKQFAEEVASEFGNRPGLWDKGPSPVMVWLRNWGTK